MGPSPYGGLTLDANNLYWTNAATGVVAWPLAGGPSSTLGHSMSSASRIALDDGNVYWTDPVDGTVNKIAKSSTTGMPVTLATNQQGAAGIAVDAKNVYWGTGPDGTVWSAPLGRALQRPRRASGLDSRAEEPIPEGEGGGIVAMGPSGVMSRVALGATGERDVRFDDSAQAGMNLHLVRQA